MLQPIETLSSESISSMSDKEIVDELLKLLIRVVPHDIKTCEMSSFLIQDIGIDSLGTYELMMDAEDRFGIEIADEQLMELKQIKDLVALVRSYS